MTDIFPLHLFPSGSLASSVITTVWVGVFVVAFFNLRLGWVLSGLVVPGYLVPLIIVKPWAAAIVVGEGMLTYFLVWLFSEYGSRFGAWSNFFGRDRFFALFITSIVVRLTLDGWLLPIAGEYFNSHYGYQIDYRNNLHSFGLIIVALFANQFWKTGFLRGLIPQVVTIGLTYLIVRYGLMELTNFNIGSLGYAYEDVASSMLASPKAYIILIVTAMLASRMNLHYGWDFNGILIPALLALQWYQPEKILTSFAEAFLILGLAHLVLRLPFFQQVTMEGARKLLLFFNISFLYKFLLGYGLLWWAPDIKVSDAYGFGYLLTTLIAVKMHDKNIAARLTRSTLQTSLIAVGLASVIGFSLTLLPKLWTFPIPGNSVPLSASPTTIDRRLMDVVRDDKIGLYRKREANSVAPPLPQELDTFAEGVDALLDYAGHPDAATLARGRAALGRVNYEVYVVDGRYLYLREREPRRGWGLYAIDTRAQNRLLVEVPAPLDEIGTVEAGVSLFERMQARTLAIAGSARKTNVDGSADVLANSQTMLAVFHRQAGRRDVLQVRGDPGLGLRTSGTGSVRPDSLEPASELWISGQIPLGLNLKQLKNAIGELTIHWGASPSRNFLREQTRESFAELTLSRSDIREVVLRQVGAGSELPTHTAEQSIEGYLQQWLLQTKGEIAETGSDLYVIPRLEELLFMDQEVVAPLLKLAIAGPATGHWTPASLKELHYLNGMAGILGYEIIRYRHARTGQNYLILAQKASTAPRRYWGTYVFRVGPADGYLVQVPRPAFELQSFEYGVSLFERLRARALLIAGASPAANLDGSADVTQARSGANMFNLAAQVILRETGTAPMMAVQSRAFGVRADSPAARADVLLAFADGTIAPQQASNLGLGLARALEQSGHVLQFVDGGALTAGYEVGHQFQSLYLDQTQNKEFAIAWVSPLARASYRQQLEKRPLEAQFLALRIASREVDVRRDLAGTPVAGPVPRAVFDEVQRYLVSEDMVALARLARPERDFVLERLIDRDTQQALLALRERQSGRLLLLARLGAPAAARPMVAPNASSEVLNRFQDNRSAMLSFDAGHRP